MSLGSSKLKSFLQNKNKQRDDCERYLGYHTKKAAKAVTLLTCIEEMPGSNLGRDTCCPYRILVCVPHSLQANAGTVL
jgi:hypothetical protein